MAKQPASFFSSRAKEPVKPTGQKGPTTTTNDAVSHLLYLDTLFDTMKGSEEQTVHVVRHRIYSRHEASNDDFFHPNSSRLTLDFLSASLQTLWKGSVLRLLQ